MMLRMNASESQPNTKFRVYAIAARSSIESMLSSHHFVDLGFVEVNNLVAIVGSIPVETIDGNFTLEQLTAFSDRIDELHRAFDVLPFRFASAAAVDEIAGLLQVHQESYTNNLVQIAGCSEVNARWVIDDSSEIACFLNNEKSREEFHSGSDYLRSKHRAASSERKSAQELTSIAASIGLQQAIHCVASQGSLRRLKTDDHNTVLVFGVEVLLRRADVQPYISMLSKGRFRNCLPTIASGPWPPYSFISDVNFAMTKAPLYAPATAKPVQKRAIFPEAEAAS